jgi:hypothetical protein
MKNGQKVAVCDATKAQKRFDGGNMKISLQISGR